jgi:hypothetical protein
MDHVSFKTDLNLILDSEDAGTKITRNVGNYLKMDTA